jgi:hypothetical protein
MKNYIDRNANRTYQYDLHGNLLHVFQSKYAAAKWIIKSGLSGMEDTTTSYVRLSGGLKSGFNRNDNTLMNYGYKWVHGEKFKSGDLYNDQLPSLDDRKIWVVFSNGVVKKYPNYRSIYNDLTPNTKTSYAKYLNTGKFIKYGEHQIALFQENIPFEVFRTKKEACEKLKCGIKKLNNALKKDSKVNNIIVIILKIKH